MTLIQDHPNEYKIYRSMLKNCNPGPNCYSSYEDKGITVCQEWLKGGFKTFLKDMGTKPSNKHKLLRKDPLKGFNKDNCEWSLKALRRIDNILITLNGTTKNLCYWCKRYNLDYGNTHRKMKRLSKEMCPTDAFKKIIKIILNCPLTF